MYQCVCYICWFVQNIYVLHDTASPFQKCGWIGIGCDICTIIAFGNTYVKIELAKKLDFSMATGTNGNRRSVSWVAYKVLYEPNIISTVDNNIAAIGPLNATSKSAERSFLTVH